MHSDWLKTVTLIAAANKSVSLQHSLAMLLLILFMTSAPNQVNTIGRRKIREIRQNIIRRIGRVVL